MKSKKILKNRKFNSKTKTITKTNNSNLKGGYNDILSLFLPNNPLLKTKVDSETKENIEFITPLDI